MGNLKLVVNPKEFGLQEKEAKELIGGLPTILKEREVLIDAYEDMITQEINEETIPLFRALRIQIRDNRTKGIVSWHKKAKDYFLNGGRFVDSIKNKEIEVNERLEEKLLKAEKHFENLEKERLENIQKQRVEELSKYLEDAHERDLSCMEEDVWKAYLNTKKDDYEARLQAERKAEEERKEAERLAELARIKREKEIEAQRLENERLKKEAEEKANLLKERNEVLRPYINLIRDYDVVMNLDEKSFKLELENLSKIAIAEANFKAEQEAKAEAERLKREKDLELMRKRAEIEAKRRAKIEAELEAKRQAELKAENERKEAERLAKLEADRLAKAPIKDKLNNWVNSFEIQGAPISNEVTDEINAKFTAFKKWAINQIEKI